jgi:hypothetical protein
MTRSFAFVGAVSIKKGDIVDSNSELRLRRKGALSTPAVVLTGDISAIRSQWQFLEGEDTTDREREAFDYYEEATRPPSTYARALQLHRDYLNLYISPITIDEESIRGTLDASWRTRMVIHGAIENRIYQTWKRLGLRLAGSIHRWSREMVLFDLSKERIQDRIGHVRIEEEAVVDEFHASPELAMFLLKSRDQLAQERSELQKLLRDELGAQEASEWEQIVSKDESVSKGFELAEAQALIDEEIGMFIEAVSKISLANTAIRNFPLTREHATKFLPSVETALLTPFRLISEFSTPFLNKLLEELRPVARSGAFGTRHGRLVMHGGELFVERKNNAPRRFSEAARVDGRMRT